MWHKLDVSSFTVAVYFYDIAAMRKTTNSKLSQYVGTALYKKKTKKKTKKRKNSLE